MGATQQRIEQLYELKLKRAHAILIALAAIIAPPLTAYGSYMKAMSDIKTQFVEIRLEAERQFVKKDSMDRFGEKLDRMSEQLSQIKGYLDRRSQRGVRRGIADDKFALREDR